MGGIQLESITKMPTSDRVGPNHEKIKQMKMVKLTQSNCTGILSNSFERVQSLKEMNWFIWNARTIYIECISGQFITIGDDDGYRSLSHG